MSLDSMGMSSSIPQPEHQLLHSLTAEDAQQVILQGQIESRAAGIALAASAARS